jgi:leader peptidase (prepilin peptidase)/N-methyltransferase
VTTRAAPASWIAVATVCIGCLVEAAMVGRFGLAAPLPAYLALGAIGTAASVSDLRTRRIPTALFVFGYPAVGALLAVASAIGPQWWLLARAVLAAALVSCFYLALALAFPGQLGLADVYLGGLLGLGLGWLDWSAVVIGVLAGWLSGALVIALFASVHRRRNEYWPLGPFLVVGGLVGILVVR